MQDPRARQAVQPDAVLGHARREGRRVRAVLVAVLDRFVGDEPGVAAAAAGVGAAGPARHVRRVLVLDADRAAVERRAPARREVEDELLAVVDEPLAVDRLVVADVQVAGQTGARAGRVLVDRDRLDPVDGVLELQVLARRLGHVQRRPGVGRLGADVQEERSGRVQRLRRRLDPGAGPVQIAVPGQRCRRSSGSARRGCRAAR